MDLGSHATLKDKHEIVLFYKIINGLAPQYMLDLIYSCFATDDHAYTYDLMSVGKFTVFHFFALLPYIYMSVGNFYCLPLFFTTSYCSSFIPSIIKSLNKLDAEIDNS